MRHRLCPALTLALAALATAGDLSAQIRASEPASIVQTVDGTVLTVEYSRPRLRGRDSIFGDEVKWEEVWTPGANYATTLQVSKDVTIEDRPVPAGKYSVWMVVHPGASWTAVLDPRDRLFHTAHPDSTPEQIRFPVTRIPVPVEEVLAWSFPAVSSGGTTLRLNWAGAQVDLRVRVPASRTMTFAADSAGPYLGAWTGRFEQQPDSVPSQGVTIVHEEGTLWLLQESPPFPGMGRLALLPVRHGWFNPAMVQDGELYDVWSEVLVEFEPADGRAVGFVLRSEDDEVFFRGTRVD